MEEYHGLGTYTEAVGNIGEGAVFQACREIVEEVDSPTVLIFGGSLDLCGDFLEAGWKLIFVHSDEEALKNVSEMLKRLSADDDLVERQFRTQCRNPDEDFSDLVAGASVVVVVGLLHHLKNPSALLSGLLNSNRPVVVLDTTTELMEDLIVEDSRLHGRICDGHFVCRDAAKSVGFCTIDDIEELFFNLHVRPVNFFQYQLLCCWCDEAERGDCKHRGQQFWLAVWSGA